MSELLDRLQAALGGVYHLERELGGGGMSRVFLAQEAALGRKVVIKVLPPELGAGLNIDRFRREIQLAAALQPPHIVPLLAAGQAGELLYYTMPLVEGESLRARLLRQRELPIGEVVRFLRDVVDALACAHEHGVVHRDIKPDNVLVSRNHGMVTDFGVAKALSDSTGGNALTSVGVALGTPAYMAPEQASADPTADHRVDIYAVGALGYEMLAGRPPFTGASPQAVLVAQVTQAPAPLTEHRATVPPGLAALVMRCLEKKPADRWQTADELLHHLEAMATPSGGTQPVPAIRSADVAASVAASGPWAPPAGSGRRRAVLLAAGAAVALGLGGWLLARGQRSAAADAAAAKMLAVLPFKNLGAAEDQYFADGLTEEITSRLAGVNGLGVISRTSADQYRNTPKSLRQVGKELGAGYVLEGSVRWEKSGGASRVRVTPQLIRVSDDRHLWADRYDAELADVFKVQGDIAEEVTGALNVALAGGAKDAVGAQPTAVPEAYDYYLRGLEYERNDLPEDRRLARGMYEKAVALDPRFALAFARLSRSYARMVFNSEDSAASNLARAQAASDSALRLAPDLPEAHVARGFYHYWGLRDFDAALREFAIGRASRPNDADVLYAIGLVKRRQGRWEESLDLLRRAAELDPRSMERQAAVAEVAFVTRKYEVARDAAARVMSLSPDLELGYLYAALVPLLSQADTVGAQRIAREALAHADSGRVLVDLTAVLYRDPSLAPRFARIAPADFDDDSAAYGEWRGQFESLHGRRDWARAAWDSARVVLEAKVKAAPKVGRLHSALGLAYAGLGRKVEAVAEGRRALELTPRSADALDHTVAVADLSRIYVRVGDLDAAMDQLEYLDTIPSYFALNGYRVFPDWAPLRGNARFQRLLASGRP